MILVFRVLENRESGLDINEITSHTKIFVKPPRSFNIIVAIFVIKINSNNNTRENFIKIIIIILDDT